MLHSHDVISSFAAFLPVVCCLSDQKHNDNHIQTKLIANEFEFEYVSNSGRASILNVSTNAKHS